MNFLTSKHVFRYNSTGAEIVKVVPSLLQRHGVEYMETCIPVVNIITLQMLFGPVVILGFELDQKIVWQ